MVRTDTPATAAASGTVSVPEETVIAAMIGHQWSPARAPAGAGVGGHHASRPGPARYVHPYTRLSRKARQKMPSQKPQAPFKLGDRARSKLNRRAGTIDAVDSAGG